MATARGIVRRVLDRRGLRRLLGIVASLDPKARESGIVRVFFADGVWVRQYRDAFLVNPTFGLGRPPAAIEEYTHDLYERVYEPAEGDVVVDVGAGVGTEVLRWSRCVGPRGKVVAIEAHPRTFACLKVLCDLNRLGNVVSVNLAVSDSAGTATIDDAAQHISSTILSEDGCFEVESGSIDDLLERLGVKHVDFLKMNIEGAEKLAIRGMTRTALITRHVTISCHDFKADRGQGDFYRTRDEVRRFLEDSGFTVSPPRDDPRPWVADQVDAART